MNQSVTVENALQEESSLPPMRTYFLNHAKAGYVEITIPLMNLDDVEVYLARKLAALPVVERLKLRNDIMRIATEMWNGYLLWVGDAEEARLELRQDDDVARWLEAIRGASSIPRYPADQS